MQFTDAREILNYFHMGGTLSFLSRHFRKIPLVTYGRSLQLLEIVGDYKRYFPETFSEIVAKNKISCDNFEIEVIMVEKFSLGDKELQQNVENESQLDLDDAFRDLYRLLGAGDGSALTSKQQRAFGKGANAVKHSQVFCPTKYGFLLI